MVFSLFRNTWPPPEIQSTVSSERSLPVSHAYFLCPPVNVGECPSTDDSYPADKWKNELSRQDPIGAKLTNPPKRFQRIFPIYALYCWFTHTRTWAKAPYAFKSENGIKGAAQLRNVALKIENHLFGLSFDTNLPAFVNLDGQVLAREYRWSSECESFVWRIKDPYLLVCCTAGSTPLIRIAKWSIRLIRTITLLNYPLVWHKVIRSVLHDVTEPPVDTN